MDVCWVSDIYIYIYIYEKNLIYPNISQQQQATIGHSELHNLICSEIGWESSDGVEMVFRVSTKVRRYRRWEGEGPQLLMGCPEQMWALFITTDQRAFFMPLGLRIKKGATSSSLHLSIYRGSCLHKSYKWYILIYYWKYTILSWKLMDDIKNDLILFFLSISLFFNKYKINKK